MIKKVQHARLGENDTLGTMEKKVNDMSLMYNSADGILLTKLELLNFYKGRENRDIFVYLSPS